MKRIILLCAVFMISLFAVTTKANETMEQKNKIQVAILLDTSGSMQGLIEQAKSRLWNIVNTLTTLKFKGKEPLIEIALYEYGSYHRYEGDFIRQITPFTTDLDLISQELFALTTGGSEEYCGTVISRATKELEWGRGDNDMKIIYIAGNEIFEQGGISYKSSIPQAVEKDIYIHTIHCGDRQIGIRDQWKRAADLGKGKYFNIDIDASVRWFDTPYDDRLNDLNMKLNDTYVSYGSMGKARKVSQSVQDSNAKSLSSANYAERVVSKSKSVYQNSNWDLVDKMKEDKEALSKIKKSDLPEELQSKSTAELKSHVEQMQKERETIQKEINQLSIQRQTYIDKETEKSGEEGDDLGAAITQSIMELAGEKGYTVNN